MNPRLNRKLDIILEIQYHGIVALGMILTIVAVVHILDGGEISKNRPLLDAGSAISCVAWVIVVLWAVWSHSMNRRFSSYADMQTSENGKMVSKSKHVIYFLYSIDNTLLTKRLPSCLMERLSHSHLLESALFTALYSSK